MPTFMDRHDLEGARPEDVAGAHQQDLWKQADFGVRFLTYWFDEARGSVFCLAEAPNEEALLSVHREAHGGMPYAIFEVDPRSVTSFLGAIVDPAPGTPWAASAFRTIMITDIVGSTALIDSLGDVAAKDLVLELDRLVRAEVAKAGGTVVDHTGDGIMSSFPSARDAVGCAIGIQRALSSREPGDHPMQVRVGLAAGEPIEEDGRLFGAAVNLAARICTVCDPGTIKVAGGVRELALGKGFTFVDCGEATLKGFDDPLRVYEVPWTA
ncbi:MAG: nickel-binding protein [Actinomycetota bacterium]